MRALGASTTGAITPRIFRCTPPVPRRYVRCALPCGARRMERHRFRTSSTVRASVSADGLVLLDVHDGLLLASNPVGARIWQLIDERRTPLEIARQLAEDYDVASECARRDVLAFITALVERGLVTQEPTIDL